MRYYVCKFPSFHGTPWKFKTYFIAVCAGYIRRLISPFHEIRLIDSETSEHVKIWL